MGRIVAFAESIRQHRHAEMKTMANRVATAAVPLLFLIFHSALADNTRPSPPLHSAPYPISIDARAYGATIDNRTDDSRAINAALAAVGPTGATVFVADGNVRLSQTIVISKPGTTLLLGAGTLTSTANPVISVTASNVTIRGAGYLVTDVYAKSATNDIIVANGGAHGISGLSISELSTDSHTAVRTAGHAIHMIKVGNWRIGNVYLHDPWIGIAVDNSHTGFASNVTMNTTLESQSLYDGIQHINGSVQNAFDRVSVTSAKTAVHAGFYVGRETDSFQCDHCLVQASGIKGAAYGFIFANESGAYYPRWIKITDSFVEPDKKTGIGYEIDTVRDIEISNSYAVWGKNNYHITATAQTVKIRGGSGQLAYQAGLLIDGGDDIDIDGLTIDSASQRANRAYDGIAITGGSNIHVRDSTSGNSMWRGHDPASATNFQRYGISTMNAADYYWLTDNNTVNRLGTGGIRDAATGKHKVVSGNF